MDKVMIAIDGLYSLTIQQVTNTKTYEEQW
jgi:hypothetical protein